MEFSPTPLPPGKATSGGVAQSSWGHWGLRWADGQMRETEHDHSPYGQAGVITPLTDDVTPPLDPSSAPSGPRKQVTCCSSLRGRQPPRAFLFLQVPQGAKGPLPPREPRADRSWGVWVLIWALWPVSPNPVGLPPSYRPSTRCHCKERKTEAGTASPTHTFPSPFRTYPPTPDAPLAARGTWARPPQVGGVPLRPSPPRAAGGKTQPRAGSRGQGRRPSWNLARRLPHSPRSAPLRASASRRLRARLSAVQGSIARDGTGRARLPFATRSLGDCRARRRAGRARPRPRPPGGPVPEAPPPVSTLPACRGAQSPGGVRAEGPRQKASRGTRADATEAHTRGRAYTQKPELSFLVGRFRGSALPPAPNREQRRGLLSWASPRAHCP